MTTPGLAVSGRCFMLPRGLAKRRHDYGSPAEHFEQVARRWSLRLATPVKAEQVVELVHHVSAERDLLKLLNSLRDALSFPLPRFG
jgi:uncharacterized protein DUF6378